MNKILFYFLLTINTFGLDFELIAKVPSTNGNEYMSRFYDRSDGSFIYRGGISVLVLNTGQFFKYEEEYRGNESKTNIYFQNDNGNVATIKEYVSVYFKTRNNGFAMLKTANQNNFIKEELVYTNATIISYSISQGKTNIVSQSFINEEYTVLSKLNYKGEVIETKKTKTYLLGPDYSPKQDFNGFSSNKSIITYELKDGFVYFYRLTDSDLLSSPNRITLGSSQNGSLTATVNNPEQALLNIQSSTNLIDWNTFKTIQNEPSLEIIVPANKPKEFIRAIE